METKDRIREGLGKKIADWEEKNPRRIYFTLDKEDIFGAVEFLFRQMGLRFAIASGMQTPEGFEILYHFCDDSSGIIYSARVLIQDGKNPAVKSITPIFPGAEWIEREMWEMLGINFIGHPNLKRLLLSDDWPQGQYPLRQNHEP
ncbi:MAG: NADH-quinone oxidoreductase subunit C [Candidatus Omnitrophica bacterium]|nr:NADH-quinone oxidoreductase subunit C [Candidatus Omnitrophota bacterium]